MYKKGMNGPQIESVQNLFLGCMKDKSPYEMKKVLILPMTKHELLIALEAMAMEKAPRPNGVIIDFFNNMWIVVGKEYTTMV
jgi:hypothetical protein